MGSDPRGESQCVARSLFARARQLTPQARKERGKMSLRKLLLPAIVAVLLSQGAQGMAGGTTPVYLNDGTITAKDVRSLIFNSTDRTRTRGRITPDVALIDAGQLKIRSASCKKGDAWAGYGVLFSGKREGGTRCDGKTFSRRTGAYGGPFYGMWRMRFILDYIISEGGLTSLGSGRPSWIKSNGEVAVVVFRTYANGKATNTDKVLRIVGSEVTVIELRPGERWPFPHLHHRRP